MVCVGTAHGEEDPDHSDELEFGHWFKIKVSQFFSELVHEFVPWIGFDGSVIGIGFFPKISFLEILVFMMTDDIVDGIFSLQVSDQGFIGCELGLGKGHVIASDVFEIGRAHV